jgi:hypothetical protein
MGAVCPPADRGHSVSAPRKQGVSRSTPSTPLSRMSRGPGQFLAWPDMNVIESAALGKLYRNLPVGDMVRVARNLNRRWDSGRAADRLERLGIAPRQKVGELSGGQKAQLALSIALARRPGLLVLDEPLAALDPVAWRSALAACEQPSNPELIAQRVATLFPRYFPAIIASFALGGLPTVVSAGPESP